jgi:lipopolysaccharide/colanic/teichoic acid biosynthesis glycosyltransferase
VQRLRVERSRAKRSRWLAEIATFPYLIGFEQRFVNRVKTWFPIIFSATLSGQASRDSRSSAPVEEAPPTEKIAIARIDYDLDYIATASLWLDAKIILRTVAREFLWGNGV